MRHSVAAVIRDLIVQGKVAPGELLRLRMIADELDVSITPVREALLLLASDGWLKHEPSRGFIVQPVRRRDAEDIYLMWGKADGAQAARAASNATREDIELLRKIDSALRDSEGLPPDRLSDLNLDFHEAISRIAAAPKLAWFRDSATRLLPYEIWSECRQLPEWQELNRTGHTAVVDAIEAGDSTAAEARMEEHYRDTSRVVLSWLDSLAFWSA